jgi:hypothetical protein
MWFFGEPALMPEKEKSALACAIRNNMPDMTKGLQLLEVPCVFCLLLCTACIRGRPCGIERIKNCFNALILLIIGSPSFVRLSQ